MPNVSFVPSRISRYSLKVIQFLAVMLVGGGELSATPLDDAMELFAERRYAEAEEAFTQLEQEFPDHPQVLLYLGKLAAKRHDQKTSLQYLDRAMELRPNDAEMNFEYGAACGQYAATLGTSFSALSHARRASKAILRAIELDPSNLSYRQGMIGFSLNAPAIAGGGHKRAKAQADAIAKINPTQGAYAHAGIHRAQGDHGAALKSLDALIAISPDNYHALFNFGRCAAESGERLEEGLVHLQTCLTLPAPDRAAPPAEVWWKIATIKKRQNDRDAAIHALEQAVALAPTHRHIADDLKRFLAEES